MSWLRKKNEMSVLRIQAEAVAEAAEARRPASEPRTTASSEAQSDDDRREFLKRFRNSSRTVLEISPMVSGDSPSERQPRQSGW